MTAIGIDDEHLPVEFQQHIKRRIAGLSHTNWLSD
jgi:hypothetical protein